MTFFTGGVDELASSSALRTGPYLLIGDITFLPCIYQVSCSITCLADTRFTPGSCTASLAFRTASRMADTDLFIPPGDDLLKRYDHLDSNIISPRRSPVAPFEKTVEDTASETAQIKSKTACTAEYLIKVDTAEKVLL